MRADRANRTAQSEAAQQSCARGPGGVWPECRLTRPPGDAAALLGHRSKPPLRDPDVFARVPVKSFRYNARRESKWGGQPST